MHEHSEMRTILVWKPGHSGGWSTQTGGSFRWCAHQGWSFGTNLGIPIGWHLAPQMLHGAAMSTMVCTQAMPPVAPPKHPSAAAPAPVVQTQARIEVQNVTTQHSLGGCGHILGHRHHRRRDSLDLESLVEYSVNNLATKTCWEGLAASSVDQVSVFPCFSYVEHNRF